LYCALLWGVGLGGSYWLAYRGLGPWTAMQSPLAFWLMGAAALGLTALLFAALLWHTVRRPRPPQPGPVAPA
jgi:MATE family multidrug resistance protein